MPTSLLLNKPKQYELERNNTVARFGSFGGYNQYPWWWSRRRCAKKSPKYFANPITTTLDPPMDTIKAVNNFIYSIIAIS